MAISQNFPAIRPTLSLNFARSRTLDPRITFTRSSIGTYFDREGIIRTAAVNQARFDHDPVTGESLGLLIEEQRTNLHLYSQEINLWVAESGGSVVANNQISPDGTQNADTLTGTQYGSSVYVVTNLNNATTYTFSVFLKYISGNSLIEIQIGDAPFARSITRVDTQNGTLSYNSGGAIVSYSIEQYANGWYRYSITRTTTASGDGFMDINHVSSTTSEVAIWGAQLEVGSFPTSYIPTSGSTVTRSADLASISGSSFSNFYNPNGGTAYIDLFSQGVNEGGTPYQVYFNFNSDGSNRWGISHQNESRGSYASNAVLPYVGQAGVFDVLTRFSKTFVPGSRNKYAMTQPNGSGTIITGTGTQGFTFGATNKVPIVNQLYLGRVISDNGNLNGTIAEFRYYPQEFTSDQIKTLIK